MKTENLRLTLSKALYEITREPVRIKRRLIRKIVLLSLNSRKRSLQVLGSEFSLHELISLESYVSEKHHGKVIKLDGINLNPIKTNTATKSYLFSLPNQIAHQHSKYVAKIRNATLIGGTEAVILEDGRVIHDEMCLKGRKTYTGKRTDLILHTRTAPRIALKRKANASIHVDRAVSLLKEHSANYYHWLTECLTRSLLISSSEQPINIIVNDGLHQNLLDALALLHPEAHIIKLKDGDTANVETLLYPSILSQTLDNYSLSSNANDFSLDKTSLIELRNSILSKAMLGKQAQPQSAIYLRRNSSYRGLLNQPELEQALQNISLSIVEPEKLKFVDQIRIFRSAKVIISPTGAALANIIFCRKGTHVVILSNDAPARNYYIFGQIAQFLDLNIFYIEGKASEPKLHSDYEANIDRVIQLTKTLLTSSTVQD